MTDRICRHITLELEVGADSTNDLVYALERLADDLRRGEMEPGTANAPQDAISAGCGYSYTLTLIERPDVTHDSYMAAINRTIEDRRTMHRDWESRIYAEEDAKDAQRAAAQD